MHKLITLIGVLGTACGGAQVVTPGDHMAAQRDQSAAARAANREDFGPRATHLCGDPVLDDQASSGGERLTRGGPCWQPNLRIEQAQLRREDRAVAAQRAAATVVAPLADAHPGLVECRGFSEAALASPVVDGAAIAQVLPERRDGEVRGARIVLKPTAAVDPTALTRMVACQQARFASLGQPASYLDEDPTLVQGATVTVDERRGRVEVVVVAGTSAEGKEALHRAQQLARPQTALR